MKFTDLKVGDYYTLGNGLQEPIYKKIAYQSSECISPGELTLKKGEIIHEHLLINVVKFDPNRILEIPESYEG